MRSTLLRQRLAVLTFTATLLGLVPVGTPPVAAQQSPPAPPADGQPPIVEASISPETITTLVGETATATIALVREGLPQTGTVRVNVEYVDGEPPPSNTTAGGRSTRMPVLVRQGPPTGEATLQTGPDGTVRFQMNAVMPGTYHVVACPEVPGGARARCDDATVAFETLLVAVLNGDNEIAEDGSRGAGDADGVAFLSPTADGRLCYGVVVEGVRLPAAATHVHAGAADANGPVAQPLAPPGPSGVVFGCAPLTDPSTGPALLEQPGAFYVNVHTEDLPAGAVRGQIAAS